MKHLAFLSFAIGTLLAPITVQAQSGCVTFLAPHDYEVELRFMLANPHVPICPAALALAPRTWDPGQSARFGQWLTDSTNLTIRMKAINGGR